MCFILFSPPTILKLLPQALCVWRSFPLAVGDWHIQLPLHGIFTVLRKIETRIDWDHHGLIAKRSKSALLLFPNYNKTVQFPLRSSKNPCYTSKKASKCLFYVLIFTRKGWGVAGGNYRGEVRQERKKKGNKYLRKYDYTQLNLDILLNGY